MQLKKDRFLFQSKDYLVSLELFSVYWDNTYQMGWTDGISIEKVGGYYNTLKYDSHRAEQLGLKGFLFRCVQKVMFRIKWRIIKKHLKSKQSVLDIGAGVGDFAKFLKNRKIEVSLIENNEKALEICEDKGLKVYTDIEELPLNSSFQVITLWHSLEHLPNPEQIIHKIFTLLNDEGLLVIAVPNIKSHDAVYYQQNWAALDVPRHLWHFSQESLVFIGEKAGLKLVKAVPMWFDSLYISFLSEKQKAKPFSLLRGIVKGIYFNLLSLFTGRYSSKMYFFQKETNSQPC